MFRKRVRNKKKCIMQLAAVEERRHHLLQARKDETREQFLEHRESSFAVRAAWQEHTLVGRCNWISCSRRRSHPPGTSHFFPVLWSPVEFLTGQTQWETRKQGRVDAAHRGRSPGPRHTGAGGRRWKVALKGWTEDICHFYATGISRTS